MRDLLRALAGSLVAEEGEQIVFEPRGGGCRDEGQPESAHHRERIGEPHIEGQCIVWNRHLAASLLRERTP